MFLKTPFSASYHIYSQSNSNVSEHGSNVSEHGSNVSSHRSNVSEHGSYVSGHGSNVSRHGSSMHSSDVISDVSVNVTTGLADFNDFLDDPEVANYNKIQHFKEIYLYLQKSYLFFIYLISFILFIYMWVFSVPQRIS